MRKNRTLSDKEQDYKNRDEIVPELDENKKALQEQMGLDQSFDVVLREMEFAGKRTGLLYLNGFAKEEHWIELFERLSYLTKEELRPPVLKSILDKYLLHIQVSEETSMKATVQKVLTGMSALFIEGEQSVLIVDAKKFPVRSIEEPSLERVVRGPRDGFVETMLTNINLVRRRLRDPRAKFELSKVGKRSSTDVCIGYIGDISDLQLVESVKKKLAQIQLDGLPMADKQLEEALVGKGWNPYPLVRYTERPDVAAVHLLEGHIVLFVDTSPSVMILPTTFFHHVQHAEEYTHTPVVGTYLRWIRFFGIFASLFLLPLWFLYVTEPHLVPETLDFIGPQEAGKLPLLVQFFVAEVGIDLMRMAAVHTPTPLATAMGLIAAILIGEIAVQAGFFVNEVILYVAVAAVGMFATPSYELSLANRIVRLGLLIAVAFFKIPGLVIGTTAVMLILIVQRSYNSPYLWPFIPFDAKAFFTIVVRRPIQRMDRRLSLTGTNDSTRQPQKN